MRKITLDELLQHGVHFGHQRKRWNPQMQPYIFALRNGVYVINLESTLAKLEEALAAIQDMVKKGGSILFVGTKRQAKDIVRREAERAGMPFIVERWLGGMFTNFNNVSNTFKRYNQLNEDKKSGRLEKYTKKEQLLMTRDIERLERMIGGVAQLKKLPEAIFVVDIKHEATAVREARKKGVPIIALVDTNANPEQVTWPIPANDDATKSIELLTTVIADAIIEARQEKEAAAQAAVQATVKSQA